MSHHIHHTEGFILGSTAVGEANKYLIIFTRELGVIGAVAQAVRKGASKLRYALQDYSYVRVDVIRGKHSWRITSATPENRFDLLSADPQKFSLYVKLLVLIRRLCSGEDPNETLFVFVRDAFSFLNDHELSSDLLSGFELIFIANILHNLGYIEHTADGARFSGKELNSELCREAASMRASLIKEINTALHESQL